MYEKCPYEGDDQDEEIAIFDEGEYIKITVDPESVMPPDLNMILMVNNSASTNALHYLDEDTFVLHDVTYVIVDEYKIKPQIYLTSQQIKGIQLQDQSLAIIINKLSKE